MDEMDVGALFWLFWSSSGREKPGAGGDEAWRGREEAWRGGIRRQALGVLAGFFLFCMR